MGRAWRRGEGNGGGRRDSVSASFHELLCLESSKTHERRLELVQHGVHVWRVWKIFVGRSPTLWQEESFVSVNDHRRDFFGRAHHTTGKSTLSGAEAGHDPYEGISNFFTAEEVQVRTDHKRTLVWENWSDIWSWWALGTSSQCDRMKRIKRWKVGPHQLYLTRRPSGKRKSGLFDTALAGRCVSARAAWIRSFARPVLFREGRRRQGHF